MPRPSLEGAVALLDLPSWEHVGALLLSHGITDGAQESCTRCPVAQFLRITTGRKVEVTTSDAYQRRHRVALPQAATTFIAFFDSVGEWPDVA